MMHHNWREIVVRRARETGATLPPYAIDELAEHLEDLFTAAREQGATDARRPGVRAPRTSGR